MAKMIDYDATIKQFFKTTIAWLDRRPLRLRDGIDKEKITYEYMQQVASEPRKYLANNAMYSNIDKLEGFIECSADRLGNIVTNNDLFHAVIGVLDAIGEYYKVPYHYTESNLISRIKDFQIALNRKKFLKSTFYKMRAPYYFAQKQK